MRVMAQLSTEDIFQMKVVEDDGVGFCIQSMLRYPLHLCHVIEDRSGSPGAQEYNDFTLRELMAAGVEMLARCVCVCVCVCLQKLSFANDFVTIGKHI